MKNNPIKFIFTMYLLCLTALGCKIGSENASRIRSFADDKERFEKSGSIITDHQTDLQWRAGPDSDIDWYGSESWVDNLEGNWRMPTLSELSNLYNAGITNPDWGLFSISDASWVWSNRIRDSASAWALDFFSGEEICNNINGTFRSRVFAVRSQ